MWRCKIKCCFDTSPAIVTWKTAELQANATFVIVNIHGMIHVRLLRRTAMFTAVVNDHFDRVPCKIMCNYGRTRDPSISHAAARGNLVRCYKIIHNYIVHGDRSRAAVYIREFSPFSLLYTYLSHTRTFPYSSEHQYLHMHDCQRKPTFPERDSGNKFTVNTFHFVPYTNRNDIATQGWDTITLEAIHGMPVGVNIQAMPYMLTGDSLLQVLF